MFAESIFQNIELSLPHTLTILCTYKCTAACAQCCFESSPRVKGRLSLDTILARISEAKASFPGLRLVVFSGGEAFMLKDDLYAAVRHATSLEMMTRIVTNGSWGKTPTSASAVVEKLIAAGITEINISTGVDHLEWVPLESVVNAALALCEAGVKTLVTVEADTADSDCMGELRRNSSFLRAIKSGNLQLLNNSWMPFSDGAPDRVKNFDVSSLQGGCTQIFSTIVVTPHDNLSACCGLTLEHIPEMRLGHNSGTNMRELYNAQRDDFLKFWIHVDGPYTIVKRVMGDDASALLADVSHICQACVILHQTPTVRERLARDYEQYIPEVMTRFALSNQILGATAPAQQAPSPSITNSLNLEVTYVAS